MAALDLSSRVFYHFAESLKLHKDGMRIKIALLPSNFCRLAGMNFYVRKRHTLMVSFMAVHLRSDHV